ncbi:MAG: 50S ribosomal protein L17 [Candidatus Azobacteroides sp.]|nr:50S ribosomal protein L17 [Candidatus Azobacteroides sp.]
MRHNDKINHLGRTYSHRAAMLSNMAVSLIKHKRIFTTLAKAKELRKYVEPIITKSKNDTTHSRRLVFQSLHDKYAVTELFKEISQKIGDRPGGYTRIIKIGNRLGDNASMCFIELVDYNELMLKGNESVKSGRTRRSTRRGSGKSSVQATPAAPAVAKAQEGENAQIAEEIVKASKTETPETENHEVAQ